MNPEFEIWKWKIKIKIGSTLHNLSNNFWSFKFGKISDMVDSEGFIQGYVVLYLYVDRTEYNSLEIGFSDMDLISRAKFERS